MPCADHNINVCMSVCGGGSSTTLETSWGGSWGERGWGVAPTEKKVREAGNCKSTSDK